VPEAPGAPPADTTRRYGGNLSLCSLPHRYGTVGSDRWQLRRSARPEGKPRSAHHRTGDRRQRSTTLITNRIHQRLLAGPPLSGGAEPLDVQSARLGTLPRGAERDGLISTIEASGLLGRGGAGFPVGRKWRALADRRYGSAVVVVNGAEGEPASAKDRTLMAYRPHLVVDGAILAAEAVGADEIVFYVGQEHGAAVAAIRRAVDERRREIGLPTRLVRAPVGYVAGEASAAVHFINDGDARPTTTPPRVSELGVNGRPTLVQNVESLAYAALIARFGDHWYRSAGRFDSPGTALVTVTGGVREPGVREIELGQTAGEVAVAAGADPTRIRAFVLGGYFGTWARTSDAWSLPLDPAVMRDHGLTFGCGIVGLLPDDRCGVLATAEIMAFMARESAGQCGPCVFGLRAIGESTRKVAQGEADTDEVRDLERWASQLPGRGACHHPDGAIQLLVSALDVFGDEFTVHARTGRCSVTGSPVRAAVG
jgi:NADH:ubiquinone oxidoreductase subunit F (NADH-binding)